MNLKDIVRESVITRQVNKTNVVFEDSALKNIINEQTRVKLTNKVVSNAKLVCENASSRDFSKVLKENFDIENYTNERLEEFGLVLENYNLVTQIRDIVGVLTESYNEKYSDYFKEILTLEQELSEGVGEFLKNTWKSLPPHKYLVNPIKRKVLGSQQKKGHAYVKKLEQQKADLERQLVELDTEMKIVLDQNRERSKGISKIPTAKQSLKKDLRFIKQAPGKLASSAAGMVAKTAGRIAKSASDYQKKHQPKTNRKSKQPVQPPVEQPPQ
jgi:small nuclear ribonucleoprotein (snRNP)-like protein